MEKMTPPDKYGKRRQITFRIGPLAEDRLRQVAALFHMKPTEYAKAVLYQHLGVFNEPLDQRRRTWRKKKQESKFDEEKAFRDTTAEGALPGVTVEDLKRGKKDRDKRHRTAVVETDVEADSEFDFEEEAEFRHGRSSTAHEGSIRIR
ncbi:MAG: hypothetical protein QXV21_03415 [Candidatus Bathyarchaeia archaeon]